MRTVKLLLSLLTAFSILFTSYVLADIRFDDLEQISAKRVGRTIVEYEFKANVTNTGNSAENITAIVTSSASATVIINGNLTFSNLASGESGASGNNLVFRQDRLIPFSLSALLFDFNFDEANTNPNDLDSDNDGFTPNEGDCNDTNPAINPDAVDIPDNGIDENCDGNDAITPPDDLDSDNDGFTPNEGDCDDTNPAINPDAVDIPDNGIDENCDGNDAITPPDDLDSDNDGFTPNEGDCNDTNPAINPDAVEIPDNGIDENCDGSDTVTPPGDLDTDNDEFTPNEGDCNDTDPAINPDAVDIPDNGIDENCDGSDAVTPPGDLDKDDDGFTLNQGDCDDNNPEIFPGATDTPNNGIDENCDGSDTIVGPNFTVRIASPESLLTVGVSPITVSGTVESAQDNVVDNVILTVNGVPVSINGGAFSAEVEISEGHNTIVARGVNGTEQVTDTISISLDQTPPFITIESHQDGQEVFTQTVTVTGLINDIVRGTIEATQANVSVNGVSATISNRSYAAKDVSLIVGENTITATGADQVGNVGSKIIKITYIEPTGRRIQLAGGQSQSATINTQVAEPLAVRVIDDNLNPVADQAVIFRVTQGSGMVGTALSTQAVVIDTNSDGQASTGFLLGSRVGEGNHKVRAQVVGYDDDLIFNASATGKLGNKISINSGNNQRGSVGQVLPEPLVVVVTDDGANVVANARVEFNVTKGEGLLQNGLKTFEVITDSDGRATSELTLGYLTGLDAQRISATLLDAVPGPVLIAGFSATAFVPAAPEDTRISGVVLDNQDNPIPGVTMRIEDSTRQAASDNEGQFEITNTPIGPVHLIADGSTASIPGEFPSLSFNLVTISGVNNPLPSPIYMVKLDTENAIQVGEEDAVLTLDKYPGFKLEIAAGSVTFPDGSKTGLLSVTQVNANKVPMPPPNGMQPQFIVTIQPTNTLFDPPAKLTLPNTDGFVPGAQVEMYSFDHDLEEFVAIGLGSVSADGTLVTSNPGVGVIKAGWHCGSQPGGQGCAHNCPICKDCDGDCNCVAANDDPRLGKCETCKNGVKKEAPTEAECCTQQKIKDDSDYKAGTLLGTVVCCKGAKTLCVYDANFTASGTSATGDAIGKECVGVHEHKHFDHVLCADGDCETWPNIKPGVSQFTAECEASKAEKSCLDTKRTTCADDACRAVVDGWIQEAINYGNQFGQVCF